jgi:hypothetical protein
METLRGHPDGLEDKRVCSYLSDERMKGRGRSRAKLICGSPRNCLQEGYEFLFREPADEHLAGETEEPRVVFSPVAFLGSPRAP